MHKRSVIFKEEDDEGRERAMMKMKNEFQYEASQQRSNYNEVR